LKEQKSSENGITSTKVRPRELSKREREVLKLVAEGCKNREIAEQLGVAVKTVETHRANINNKLAFRNVAQLIRYAIQKGLVSVEIE
jgi:DNA-binding NarL/FixJ family response regulator